MSSLVAANGRKGTARLIRKIGTSLGIGAIAYAITELADQPRTWSLMLSVFIGGVVLVVQFLVDLEIRVARVERVSAEHMQRVAEMVSGGFEKISAVTELLSLIEASPLQAETVARIVRHSTELDPNAPPLVHRFAEAETARFSAFLEDLGRRGSLLYEGEDRDWLLTLTRKAARSICATSLTTVDQLGRGFTDGGLWESDLGQRYLEAQRDAIRRGATIRRIAVVIGTAGQRRPDLRGVWRPQQEIGVDVRVLYLDDLPVTRHDAMRDFVLFDDAVLYETTVAARIANAAVPTMLDTRLELNPERVANYVQRFRILWESARPVMATAERAAGDDVLDPADLV